MNVFLMYRFTKKNQEEQNVILFFNLQQDRGRNNLRQPYTGYLISFTGSACDIPT